MRVLQPAALRANFNRGIQKNFQVGVREYHRPDVTPLHHHAAAFRRAPLFGHKHSPHAVDHGNSGSCLSHFGRANLTSDLGTVNQHTKAGIIAQQVDASGSGECGKRVLEIE